MRLAASIASSVTASLALAGSLAAPAQAESAPRGDSRNDCYAYDQSAFLPGLVAGDIIAARLHGWDSNEVVTSLDVLFGGSAPGLDPVEVTVKIWDDTAETDEPGAELYSGEHTLLRQTHLQSIPLAGVQVPERFRVGFVLPLAAPPSVGYDLDGTIATDDNLVFTAAGGWHKSTADGVTGDWVIRAFLSSGQSYGGCANPGGGGGGGGGDAAFGTDANGGDGGDGTGCCQSSHRGGAASAVLGLGVLALVLRRRRRS